MGTCAAAPETFSWQQLGRENTGCSVLCTADLGEVCRVGQWVYTDSVVLSEDPASPV